MLRNVHRGIALAIAIGIAVAGCGDGGSDTVEAMSVDELCTPIEDEVAAWAGASITPEHNTIYAEASEPILVCKWIVDGVDRSIRVDYVGSPDSFMLNLVDANLDRTDVIAPNLHDKNKLWVIAANGWGVVVSNLGADRSEDADPMAVIANAALAQIGS